MVWVIAFGELFFGDLWCVVWGYGGMRTHFSLLNPHLFPPIARRTVADSPRIWHESGMALPTEKIAAQATARAAESEHPTPRRYPCGR